MVNDQHCYFIKLSKNKGIEIEWFVDTQWVNYFNLNIRIDRHVDHAGIEFSIELFGITKTVKFYDFRHWDNDNNCWENCKL